SPTTRLGRIMRLPLRLLPANLVVPVLQGELIGKRWIVGSSVHGCWLGSYEIQKQRCIASQLKPGSVFYDIGANAGFYSLLACSQVAPGRVYAFEPVPRNAEYIRRHLELNGVSNVQVLTLAISDEDGSAWFRQEQTGLMGCLDPEGAPRA